MAYDKAVDSTVLDAGLTSVADAIRQKGGTSASLTFPQGFVDAIGEISGGGIDELLDNTIKNVETSVNSVRGFAFRDATELQSIRLKAPSVTIGQQAFYGCSALTSFVADGVLSGDGSNIFVNCKSIRLLRLRWDGVFGTSSTCQGCTALEVADISGATRFPGNAFNGTSLKTLILRGSSMTALASINVFTGTPFASGGAGGTLYVPEALLTAYQSATNWNTIIGYASNRIVKIEGSQYETAYADGTPIA